MQFRLGEGTTHLVVLGEEDLSTSRLQPPFRPFTLLRLVLHIRSEKRRSHRNGLETSPDQKKKCRELCALTHLAPRGHRTIALPDDKAIIVCRLVPAADDTLEMLIFPYLSL